MTSDMKVAFCHLLLQKGTPVYDSEMIYRFYVTPGMEFKEAQNVKAAVIAGRSCYVLPDIVFLDLLCKEHNRWESSFSEHLPFLFKVWPSKTAIGSLQDFQEMDSDQDGALSKMEILETLEKFFHATDRPLEDLKPLIESFWKDAVNFQIETDQGTWKEDVSGIETVDFEAFSRAAAKHVIFRSFVRMDRVSSPFEEPKEINDASKELFWLSVVDRRWKQNKAALIKAAQSTGKLSSSFLEQVKDHTSIKKRSCLDFEIGERSE